MYFSLSTIAFYAALVSQTVVVSSAPVLSQTGDVTSHLRLRNLAVPKPLQYARRQEAAPSAASVAASSVASVAVPAATGTAGAGAKGAGAIVNGANGGAVANANAASGPKFVIYTDKTVKSANGLPAPSDIKGYTHLMLGFLLTTGPADQSKVWANLGATAQKSLKAQYAAAGIKVMVSAFGGTSAPTTDNDDPAKTAQTMAAFVKANNLDGIDVDYEDLKAVSAGTAVAWVETFMTTLRKTLPVGQFIVSHAPLAPQFSPQFPAAPAPKSAQGTYLQIDKKVGTLIDFYNVQFYNDGATVYTDCNGLLTKSDSSVPQSSLFEIAALGVSLNKLVIGKPIGATDATNGQMTPALLAQCVQQAIKQKWNAGIMGFEFADAASAAGFIGPSLSALGGKAVTGGGASSSVKGSATVGVPPVATSKAVGVPPVATSKAVGVPPVATSKAVGVPPVATSKAVGVPPVATSKAVGVPPVATSKAVGVPPVASTSAVDVPPVALTSAVGVPPVASASAVDVTPVASTSAVGVPPAASASAVGVPAASPDPGAAPTGNEPGAAPTGTEPGAAPIATGVARRMVRFGRRS